MSYSGSCTKRDSLIRSTIGTKIILTQTITDYSTPEKTPETAIIIVILTITNFVMVSKRIITIAEPTRDNTDTVVMVDNKKTTFCRRCLDVITRTSRLTITTNFTEFIKIASRSSVEEEASTGSSSCHVMSTWRDGGERGYERVEKKNKKKKLITMHIQYVILVEEASLYMIIITYDYST